MAAFPSGTALRVVYDFAASALGELSVSSEDQVVVVDAEQDSGGGSDSRSGWIRVVNRSLGPANGEVGYVPVEYVIEESKYYDGSSTTPVPERVVTGVATVAAASVDIATPAKDAIASESAATTIAPVSNMASPNDADSEDGAGLVRPPSPQHTNEVAVGTRVVVRYAYAAEKADELELKVDDIVHVVASPEGGWWKGMSGQGKLTRVGWFPSNMTEVLPESQQQLTNDDASSVNSTPDTGRASKRTSWFKKRPSSVLSVNRSEDSNSARSRSTSLDVNFGSAQSSAKSAEEPTPSSNRTSFYMFKGESKRRNTDGASRDDLDGQRSALIDELLRPFPITSWKDKADAGEVERMSATERKRQEVIWELVSTERDYYRDMRIVVEVSRALVPLSVFTR